MTLPPGQPHDFHSIGLLIMLVVALCVKFWRVTLALVTIAFITLTIYGAVLVVEGLPHVHR
jgi:hypothetical protein